MDLVEHSPYAHMFVPDALSPSQFIDMHRANCRTPEARLLLEVLRDSINLYITSLHKIRKKSKKSARAKRILEELENWFMEPMHGASAPLPFITVCLSLGIDPDWLRPKIFGMKALKHLPKPSRTNEASSPIKIGTRSHKKAA